jgi:hypothetical protein
MFNIPILVIGFNRPNLIGNLLAKLLELKACNLYIALDGPGNDEDAIKCEEVLKVVKSYSKFFGLKIIYRDYNLGCNLGVLSALDWFFNEVDFGIIIEDDVVPDKEMLQEFERFMLRKDDYQSQNVFIASAQNPLNKIEENTISRYMLISGWATWSEFWCKIRIDFFNFNIPSIFNVSGEKQNLSESIYWWALATRIKLSGIDTWDGILNDLAWRNGYKCLIPKMNLSTNIGFGPEATHTKHKPSINFSDIKSDLNLSHNIDKTLSKHFYKIKKRHSITPFFYVLRDMLLYRGKKQFEKILHEDILRRKFIKFTTD